MGMIGEDGTKGKSPVGVERMGPFRSTDDGDQDSRSESDAHSAVDPRGCTSFLLREGVKFEDPGRDCGEATTESLL